MKRFFAMIIAFAIVSQGAFSQPTPSAPAPQVKGKHASDADRRVLEALLLVVLEDAEYPPPVATDKPQIVLHRRTPKRIEPIISTWQVTYDTGGKEMPKDAWDDLVRRNVVRLDPNSREIHYEDLPFDSRVQVANAFPGPETPFLGKSFEEVFPQARGWVEAWVPGYSKDGKTAVIRARIGPTAKPATLTAIMKKVDGKWAVAWHKYTVYN